MRPASDCFVFSVHRGDEEGAARDHHATLRTPPLHTMAVTTAISQKASSPLTRIIPHINKLIRIVSLLRSNVVSSHAASSCTEEGVTDASGVVATIQRLSKASHDLSRAEAFQIQLMRERVWKVLMEYGTPRPVAEAAMSPMLFETSADGTPIVGFKHHSSRLPSGKIFHRKAKQTEEFLVRNQFLRCTLPVGRAETRDVVHDPVPLEHGSSAHAIVEVLWRDWKTGRQLGHAWCAVESCRFDRFPLSALEII